MKGVIVQIGEPKSIVLFNNGKIRAIPTPLNCHVGMVVTVKFNQTPKILIAAFTAILLVALGVFIGARFLGGAEEAPVPDSPWRGGRRAMMEQFMRQHPDYPNPGERPWGRRHR